MNKLTFLILASPLFAPLAVLRADETAPSAKSSIDRHALPSGPAPIDLPAALINVHPRLYANAARLDEVKALCRNTPHYKEFWERFKKQADGVQMPPKNLEWDRSHGNRLWGWRGTVPPGFKEEDARSIPAQFNAGDLSDAILCYRVTKPEVTLGLNIVRHGAADALPATVQSVRLESALSSDDSLVTRAQLQLTVGDMRFLRTTLPAESAVWCVFVNGRPVPPLREGKDYLVPLDRAAALGATSVEFIYSGRGQSGLLSRTHRFEGPRFDLPLSDIAWTLYAPANRGYYGFNGTLTHRPTADRPELVEFDDKAYTANNDGILRTNLKNAEVALKRGEEFARNGQQQEARQAFESALYYSQGKADYNEDVRLQYRNLAKQQAVVGLVNRRDELKAGNNLAVMDTVQQGAVAGVNTYSGSTLVNNGTLQVNGANTYANWTSDQAAQVTQTLSAKDNVSLNVVAEKILDQQAAAAGVATALRVTMPIEGRVLEFARPLQITPGAELSISFKTTGGGWLHSLLTLAAFAGAWLLFRVLCGFAARPAQA